MFEEEKRIYRDYVAAFPEGKSLGELDAPPPALLEMLRRSDMALAHRRAAAAEAEARILDRFGPAISYLELLLAIGIGMGQTMIDEVVGVAEGEAEVHPESRPRLVVTAQLWQRAASVGEEILGLVKAGFAAAALARWRTLHELDVLTFVLGRSTHAGALEGLLRQEERDIAKFKGDWARVYTDFPDLLGGDYAWADEFLIEADPKGYGSRRQRQADRRGPRAGRPERGPTFADLQKAVGSSARERQLYHAANGVVHGSWLNEALGSGKQDVMEDSERALRLGMTATMSAAGRSWWAITGTLTEVAEFAGASERAEEHGRGEALLAILHKFLGVEEVGKVLG